MGASWQKRARWAVAAAGIASAVLVYFALGRRPPAAALKPIQRIDPAASQESIKGNLERRRGEKRDFVLAYDTQLTYPDRTEFRGHIQVTVIKDDGRVFVVHAGAADSDKDQKVIQLSSGVKLEASDGFALTTDRATYTREQGTFHTDAPIAFSKARMSGSGTAVDYNENSDVLAIGQDARIKTLDEQGATALEFTAGSAIVDRQQDLLTLDGMVHVIRDMQIMDADHSVGHLAPSDEFVTFIELRGNARVSGGSGPLDAMSARDIDLDYTDDGKRLERVALNGASGAAIAGSNGAGSRQLTAGSQEVRLAPDNSVSGITARDNVKMVLPAAQGSPSRTIQARALDAVGAPGQGLTQAQFTDAVEFREEAGRSTPQRVVHSRRLDLALTDDAVSGATFTTDVTFEEQAFRAQAASARYAPAAGTLNLTGRDSRGVPCVADDQISVDAEMIDVTVETRKLTASGGVKTALRPRGATAGLATSPCSPRAAGNTPPRAQEGADTRLPGLLKQDQVATINADALDYGGTGKPLTYTGNAVLVQSPAMILGQKIQIDQESGNLLVTGKASSRTVQGSGPDAETLEGTAEQISYTDAQKKIEFRATSVGAGLPSVTNPKGVHVNTPQADLTAANVDILLADDGRVARLEARDKVNATIDKKRKASGSTLSYDAAKEQYVLTGPAATPAQVSDTCNKSWGVALTFSRSTDKIDVIGRNELRTMSTGGANCATAPAATR